MPYMFYNASSFADQNLSTWDVQNVTYHDSFMVDSSGNDTTGGGNTEPNWP